MPHEQVPSVLRQIQKGTDKSPEDGKRQLAVRKPDGGVSGTPQNVRDADKTKIKSIANEPAPGQPPGVFLFYEKCGILK